MAAVPHTPPVFNAPTEFPTSETERSCNICTVDFEEGIPLDDLTHSAAHPVMWHKSCIETWMARNTRCPICRINVTHLNGKEVLQAPAQDEDAAFLAGARGVAERNANRDGVVRNAALRNVLAPARSARVTNKKKLALCLSVIAILIALLALSKLITIVPLIVFLVVLGIAFFINCLVDSRREIELAAFSQREQMRHPLLLLREVR